MHADKKYFYTVGGTDVLVHVCIIVYVERNPDCGGERRKMDEQVAASKPLAAAIKPYKHSTLTYQSSCQQITLSDTHTVHTRTKCVK